MQPIHVDHALLVIELMAAQVDHARMALGQAQVVRPKPRRPRLSYGLRGTRLGAFRRETDQTTRQYTSEVKRAGARRPPTPGWRDDIKRCMSCRVQCPAGDGCAFRSCLSPTAVMDICLSRVGRQAECVSEPGRRDVASTNVRNAMQGAQSWHHIGARWSCDPAGMVAASKGSQRGQ